MPRDNGNGQEPSKQKSQTGSKVLFTFIAVPVAVLTHGYTISTLWSWFIVPLFYVPEISILQAVAIMVFVNYFVAKPDADIDVMNSEMSLKHYMTRTMNNALIKPAMALLIGWILKELIA